jgi:hypothetical protein
MSGGEFVGMTLAGAIIALGVFEVATKRAFLRFSVARKDREPALFWFAVAIKLALGAFILSSIIWRVVKTSVAG